MDRVNEGHAKNFKYEELNPDFFIHAKKWSTGSLSGASG